MRPLYEVTINIKPTYDNRSEAYQQMRDCLTEVNRSMGDIKFEMHYFDQGELGKVVISCTHNGAVRDVDSLASRVMDSMSHNVKDTERYVNDSASPNL
ncbi:MAG: hypothetical protein R6U32_05715 [Candidatus Woesearchaeota archaeon]